MLNIKDLTVVFNEGTVNEKKAIDHLSLHLEPGDFVTIIGSNGAGKSTLFGAISGAVETKEGTIVLDDKDITHEKEYVRSRTIGRLFQDPLRGTAPSMTIEENLKMHCVFYNIPKNEVEERMHFVLTLVDLLNERKKLVGALSGGMKRRVEIARGLIHYPKVLFLDEPTTGLHMEDIKRLLAILQKIVDNKDTVLVIECGQMCFMVFYNLYFLHLSVYLTHGYRTVHLFPFFRGNPHVGMPET